MRQVRSIVRERFPGLWWLLKSARRSLRESPAGRVFNGIYETNAWGAVESRSGPGSTLAETAEIRKRIPELLRELGARSLLDAPCGDFAWMKQAELGIDTYIGADLVPSLVEQNQAKYGDVNRRFVVLDIIKDPLPHVDVILCRDCLVHFSDRRILAALKNIRRSGSTYLLTTTFPGRGSSQSIETGQWQPLDLQAPPFNFPPPISLICERSTEYGGAFEDKSLALWRIADL